MNLSIKGNDCFERQPRMMETRTTNKEVLVAINRLEQTTVGQYSTGTQIHNRHIICNLVF